MTLRKGPKRTARDIAIATLYRSDFFDQFQPTKMCLTRWLRISEALACLGYRVDMIVNSGCCPVSRSPHLRYVPYAAFDWRQYDIVKTLFHRGYDSLCQAGGEDHPFIISKLGSVVGNSDATEGVYFFNEERERLYQTQQRIRARSRYVTILTEPSRLLWRQEFGEDRNVLMVPTGVDREIPPPGQNPYEGLGTKIAVYIGNIYKGTQREVNLLWQSKLNGLGRRLKLKKIRLCFVGMGAVDQLDPDAVTCLGPVENDRIWDYQYFADVGIALAQGPVQHNESSKIYYYLRAGLPVVSEDAIPNNQVIQQASCGLIARYGDEDMMADLVETAAARKWPKEEAARYMVENHTWDQRAQVYDRLIRQEFRSERI
jgi:glycosyltransferase involved in cell wall biosynthesis